MSVFDNSVGKIDAEQAALNRAKAEREAVEKSAEATFKHQWNTAINSAIRPLLEAEVASAKAKGYSAAMYESETANGDPVIGLRFMAVKGAPLLETSESSAFQLIGDVRRQRVSFGNYFDQRKDAKGKGIDKKEFGIQSLNKNTVEQYLGEFFTSAINSRL